MSATDRGAASELDLDRAAAFPRSRFGGEILDLARVGHGEWSTAFAYRQGDAARIIRFSALDDDFARDRLAARYASSALPIPAILEMGTIPGGFYAISERASGAFLDDLDAAGMRAILPALFAALDAARAVDLSSSSGYGNWGGDGHAPHVSWRAALLDVVTDRPGDRIHGWRERLQTSPTGIEPFAAAFRAMQELLPFCPEERHLIHGDLLNFNVLTADGRISAVIDWGCSLYGDFLYDLAWFCYWAPWYGARQGIDFAAEAAAHYAAIGLAIPHFAERLRCYQLQIGLAAQAYNAFKERQEALAETAQRTLELARSGR